MRPLQIVPDGAASRAISEAGRLLTSRVDAEARLPQACGLARPIAWGVQQELLAVAEVEAAGRGGLASFMALEKLLLSRLSGRVDAALVNAGLPQRAAAHSSVCFDLTNGHVEFDGGNACRMDRLMCWPLSLRRRLMRALWRLGIASVADLCIPDGCGIHSNAAKTFASGGDAWAAHLDETDFEEHDGEIFSYAFGYHDEFISMFPRVFACGKAAHAFFAHRATERMGSAERRTAAAFVLALENAGALLDVGDFRLSNESTGVVPELAHILTHSDACGHVFDWHIERMCGQEWPCGDFELAGEEPYYALLFVEATARAFAQLEEIVQ